MVPCSAVFSNGTGAMVFNTNGDSMDFNPNDKRFNHCLKKEIEHYKKYLKKNEKKT